MSGGPGQCSISQTPVAPPSPPCRSVEGLWACGQHTRLSQGPISIIGSTPAQPAQQHPIHSWGICPGGMQHPSFIHAHRIMYSQAVKILSTQEVQGETLLLDRWLTHNSSTTGGGPGISGYGVIHVALTQHPQRLYRGARRDKGLRVPASATILE